MYISAKDQLKWQNLSVKKYINLVMNIGQVMSLSDKDYEKERVKTTKMDNSSIAEVLLSAFGDGT